MEKAGIEYDSRVGINVNDKLQTSNKNVFAAGDCCSSFKFTHAADFMARLVIRNALFFGSDKMSKLLIPYATFTSPEIASVGLCKCGHISVFEYLHMYHFLRLRSYTSYRWNGL